MISFEELKTKIYSRARTEEGYRAYHILRLNFENDEYTSVPQFKESLKFTIEAYQKELKALSTKPCERSFLEDKMMNLYGIILEQFYSLWEECLK